VLLRHGLPPAPKRERTTTWAAFIRTHLALLAGTDFFTAEVLMLRGLVTYYVLFFIHFESRRVDIAGITVHKNPAASLAPGNTSQQPRYQLLQALRSSWHPSGSTALASAPRKTRVWPFDRRPENPLEA